METIQRRKEIYKLKFIALFVLIFSSFYLFDDEVSFIKLGLVIFVMSVSLYLILNSFRYYIETDQKIALINKRHFLFFKGAYPRSELYNDILSIMLILSCMISLCLIIFGVYLKIHIFVRA